MNRNNISHISDILVGILSSVILFVLLMQYVFPVVAPFLIAWFVAFVVREPASRICRVTRLRPVLVRPLLAIILTLFIFGVVALLLWQSTTLIWELLSDVAEGNNPIYDLLLALGNPELPFFGDGFSEELAAQIGEALSGMIASLLTSLASAVTGWISAIPNLLLFLLATIIALIYFAIDLERINAGVRALLPISISSRISLIRQSFFTLAGKYIASYLFIMLVTFAILLLGFVLLHVESAVALAMIISVLDILPIIGVGTVLIPWSAVAFFTGDKFLAIGLIVLFVVNTVVRELLEPRIVGKSLDMHPLLTLILIYVGYALFGVKGIVALPAVAVLFGIVLNNRRTAEVNKPAAKE